MLTFHIGKVLVLLCLITSIQYRIGIIRFSVHLPGMPWVLPLLWCLQKYFPHFNKNFHPCGTQVKDIHKHLVLWMCYINIHTRFYPHNSRYCATTIIYKYSVLSTQETKIVICNDNTLNNGVWMQPKNPTRRLLFLYFPGRNCKVVAPYLQCN